MRRRSCVTPGLCEPGGRLECDMAVAARVGSEVRYGALLAWPSTFPDPTSLLKRSMPREETEWSRRRPRGGAYEWSISPTSFRAMLACMPYFRTANESAMFPVVAGRPPALGLASPGRASSAYLRTGARTMGSTGGRGGSGASAPTPTLTESPLDPVLQIAFFSCRSKSRSSCRKAFLRKSKATRVRDLTSSTSALIASKDATASALASLRSTISAFTCFACASTPPFSFSTEANLSKASASLRPVLFILAPRSDRRSNMSLCCCSSTTRQRRHACCCSFDMRSPFSLRRPEANFFCCASFLAPPPALASRGGARCFGGETFSSRLPNDDT
mmetsp:Transcript_27900/g.95998  ORF Transcript_27900/g.95998 Transcript_27900/m.95998 type:complete len:331 (+) Transcript_27900:59-1051(+)